LKRTHLLTLAALIVLGCGSPDGGALSPDVTAAGGSAGSGGTGGSSGAGASTETPNPLGRTRCHAPAGLGSPQTIEAAVALLNALPKPTSVACFVESLDRPLTAFATSSPFSAQPALSAQSPRVFLKVGQLWLSVVVDGDSSRLIEFGYLIPDTLRSIKAEIQMPLQDVIAPTVPYQRVLFDALGTTGTQCGLCHYDEQAEPSIGLPNVYSSIAFRPRSDGQVRLDTLRIHAQTCNWQAEANRCEMLDALFGAGPVQDGAFPSSMVTFF
jgi:hypothetical protein